jgi:hypothetical protein
VSFEAEMVSIPRAELDALIAELGRLRREVGVDVARTRVQADRGATDGTPTLAREALARAWEVSE